VLREVLDTQSDPGEGSHHVKASGPLPPPGNSIGTRTPQTLHNFRLADLRGCGHPQQDVVEALAQEGSRRLRDPTGERGP